MRTGRGLQGLRTPDSLAATGFLLVLTREGGKDLSQPSWFLKFQQSSGSIPRLLIFLNQPAGLRVSGFPLGILWHAHSHNENRSVLKLCPQTNAKNSKGGHTDVWLGLSPTNLHLPRF